MKRHGIFFAAMASILLLACGSGVEQAEGASISGAQLAERIEQHTAPLVLDVRSASEYQRGHIPGSVNIPHDALAGRVGELRVAKGDEIVVHCQSGKRAQIAEATLRGNGYTNVRDLTGHWQGWEAAGLPSE